MAKLKETLATRSLHNHTNIKKIYRVLFYYGKKGEISIDSFVLVFILHWLGNTCDLEKRNGATRDPTQTAGITRDFQSEYNMHIYSAYSVCWFTKFGPLKYGSRSLSEIIPEISLEKRAPGKLTVITKARLKSVFSVARTRKIAKAR